MALAKQGGEILAGVESHAQAIELLTKPTASRASREGILASGYPGYDTSVGWFNYSDEQVRENQVRAWRRHRSRL